MPAQYAYRLAPLGTGIGSLATRSARGAAIGIPVALWSKRFAAGVMEKLPLDNPTPVALGAAAMIVVAALAAYIPARRASAVDPMEALRHE